MSFIRNALRNADAAGHFSSSPAQATLKVIATSTPQSLISSGFGPHAGSSVHAASHFGMYTHPTSTSASTQWGAQNIMTSGLFFSAAALSSATSAPSLPAGTAW